MSKPRQHWRAFDEAWFARHQAKLLWCLNGPLRRLARWLLRIEESRDLCAIGPNRYVVHRGGRQYAATFRTHWKYSKRIYHALKPVWWVMHVWDALLPARLQPALGFGFDTLTAYPDPDPESTTCDGTVYRNVGTNYEAFGALRGGNGTGRTDNDTTNYCGLNAAPAGYDNLFYFLKRVVLLFDTSAIGSSSQIDAATISLRGFSKTNGLGSPDLDIVESNPVSNTGLANADYGTLGATAFGSVSYSGFSTSAYTDISLNSAGLAAIAKTGITKLGTRTSWDRSGTFGGTWVADGVTDFLFRSADYTGTSQDPKLTVVYTVIASKSGTDSGTVTSGEASSSAISSSRFDSGTAAATESQSSLLASGRTDSGILGADESTANWLALARTDLGSLTSTELAQVGVLVLLNAVDSGLLTPQEVANLLTVVQASDSGTVASAEVRSNALWSALSDLGILSAEDLAFVAGAGSAADSGTLSAAEIAQILLARQVSDSGSVSTLESVLLVALIQVTAGDQGALSAIEQALKRAISLPPPSEAAIRIARWFRPGA